MWYAITLVEGLFTNPKDGRKTEILNKKRQQESNDRGLQQQRHNDSESNEEHTANICLTSKEVQDGGTLEYESTDEVDILAL